VNCPRHAKKGLGHFSGPGRSSNASVNGATAEKDIAPRALRLQSMLRQHMKTLSDPIPIRRRRARLTSKWIPGGIRDAAVTKEQAERFTAGLIAIANQIAGLPADFARNHDHYIHGLPKK
jgi:hypothetical protein